MPTHAVRLTLTALVVAVLAALTPGAALARATPARSHATTPPPRVPVALTTALAVGEPGGSRAGATVPLDLSAHFTATGGDGVSAMEIDMPSGALLDTTVDKGACLSAAGPTAACELAAGSATVAGASVPAALYLERSPGPNDLAGVQLVAGSLSVFGPLSLQSPLDLGTTTTLTTHIAFTGLSSSAISALSLTFKKVLRLPSSCVPEPSVTLIADPTLPRALPVFASAPLAVRDCGSLAYTPDVVSSVAVDPHTRLAKLTTTISQPDDQSATGRMKVDLPPGLVPRKRLLKCVTGSPCVIGSAHLSSPVLPSRALADGTMTLGGTRSSPTITITFPEPVPLVLSGSLSRINGQLTLNSLPDIPLTSMQLKFVGTSTGGPVLLADLANCQEAQYHATLFPISGVQPAGVTGIAAYHGCPHRPPTGVRPPTGTATLTGLASGHPRLALALARGARSPKLHSVWIRLPGGLSFNAAAVPSPHSLPKGIARERVAHGKLYLTFRPAVAGRRITLAAPLLTASSSFARHVRHSVVPLVVVVGFQDTIGDRPKLGLHVIVR